MTEFSEISEGTTKEPEKTVKILPEESLRVSEKLTITAIPLERCPNPIPEYREALEEAVKKSDGVIFEYFPQETARLSSSPFLGIYRKFYDEIMAFFTPLADLAKKHEKPAYVLDPAHDENFAAIFHELPTFCALVGTGVGGIDTFLNSVDLIGRFAKQEVFYKKRSRRQFIRGLGLLAAGLALSRYKVEGVKEEKTRIPSPPGSYPTETRFRRAIVSKGISQVGENLDKNPKAEAKSLVLFYPPVHWEGLKQLLKDREKLEKEFKICSILKKGWLKNAFFTARKYEWTGKDWQFKSGEIGGSPGPTV